MSRDKTAVRLTISEKDSVIKTEVELDDDGAEIIEARDIGTGTFSDLKNCEDDEVLELIATEELKNID